MCIVFSEPLDHGFAAVRAHSLTSLTLSLFLQLPGERFVIVFAVNLQVNEYFPCELCIFCLVQQMGDKGLIS